MDQITSPEMAADLLVTLLAQRLKHSSSASLPQARSIKVVAKKYAKPFLFQLHLRVPYFRGVVLDLECPHTLCIGELSAEGLGGLADLITISLENAWSEKDAVLRHLEDVLVLRFPDVSDAGETVIAKLSAGGFASGSKFELQPAFEQVLPVPQAEETIQRWYLLPWVHITDELGETDLFPAIGKDGANFPEHIAKWLPKTAAHLQRQRLVRPAVSWRTSP